MTRKLTLTDPDGDQLVVTQHGTSTNLVVSVYMTANPGAESEFLLTRDLARKLIEFANAPTEQAYTPAKAAQGRTERVYFTPPTGCATVGR